MTRSSLSLSLALLLAACASSPTTPAPATAGAATAAASPAPASPAAVAPVTTGAHQPAPPYWSLQLATTPSKAKAMNALESVKASPAARAELRKSGYLVRVGAWATQAEAESRAPEYRKAFGKEVHALQLQNPVDWILADGSTLPAGSAAAEEAAGPAPARAPADDALREAAARLDAATRATVKAGVARKDRYTYAMDVAPLLLYAAQRKDAALYQQLLPAAQKLVLNSKDDPYAQGFVPVRRKDGAKPEATDAGAMLWMARALWAGAEAFDRADDRAAALMVLDGYARHAYAMQGGWLVRNRFDFATRSFSSGSLVVDYAGDFLADAEGKAGRGDWRGFGERSRALVGRATGAAHLLRPLVQPEIGATWSAAGIAESVAPNNLTPLEDSCLGAEGVAASNADLARGLLAFAAGQKNGLKAFYNVDTGAASGDAPLSVGGLACLERLASALDDGRATGALDARFTSALRATASAKGSTDLEAAGALLLAAQARGAF